jgi:hypothetical protein
LAARPPIPAETRDKLLVSCRHSCCICHEQFVIIHHVDGNAANNDPDNLIPLCRNHHTIVHLKTTPEAGVQSITPKQLKLYRDDWIRQCSSIPSSFFTTLEELKTNYYRLEGEIKKLGGN